MEDKLRKYIDELFAETAPTKKAVELKEEMIQNLHDKFNDLISEGKTEEAAYNIAVAGIGDVSGLLNELESDARGMDQDIFLLEAARRKSAMFTAIAVFMYIISFLPTIIMNELGIKYADSVGVPLALLIVATATGLLIYSNMTKPKNNKRPETLVEEFREWQSDEKDMKTMRRAISSALWSVIVALYLIMGAWLNAWHPGWVIFPLGVVVEALLNVFFTLKK